MMVKMISKEKYKGRKARLMSRITTLKTEVFMVDWGFLWDKDTVPQRAI